MKKTEEFQQCLNAFKEFPEIIIECVNTFLYDLKSFASGTQEYVVGEDKIGYKDQDGISYSISYGYKTLFAYFTESEGSAPNITETSLDRKIALLLDCGSFSYAEIPKRYSCIMGVTGTLKTLSKAEKTLLADAYQIKTFTYIPSVYNVDGKKEIRSCDSSDDCKIEPETGINSIILREIKTRLKGKDGYARAVLVFFDSAAKLKKFADCDEMKIMKSDIQIITESTPPIYKEQYIGNAVLSGKVTLLTKVFGRGVDFICYDDKLLSNGGVHVIQTFLLEELSEESQIKGRTARQGTTGSYSMILIDSELEKYDINNAFIDKIKGQKSRYTEINKKRCTYFENKYPESMRYVEEIREDHNKSVKFIESIFSHNISVAKGYLLTQNKSPKIIGEVWRVICLMDATGSMGGLITKAKNTVKVMFERLGNVLEEQGMSTNLQMQYAVFRNYSNDENTIIQYSSWESKAEGLRTFIDSISAHSGLNDGEAVEIGLTHVRLQHDIEPVHQVILIGDMSPNPKDSVIKYRRDNMGGESYWNQTRYGPPTYYMDEVSKLKSRNIIVDTFYVDDAAKDSFQTIVSSTGGLSAYLDVNSTEGANMLIDSVCVSILKEGGGDKEVGKALVNTYKEKFRAGYVS